MRIALFGGTFDPVHRGHLAIASAAADAFALDRVLFAPVGRQPLKDEAPVAGYAERLTMVGLACEGEPRFAVSEIDAPRTDEAPNYTSDTLERLAEMYPEAQRFGIAGADSFLTLPHWHDPRRVIELAEWIVVSRPGAELEEGLLYAGFEAAAFSFPAEERGRVHLLTTVNEDVSATELRARLRAGEPCDELLPSRVAKYIRAHGLYR